MVFKAHDTILSRTVALKVIPKTIEDGMTDGDIFSREEARKRLIQEAKAAGRLAHPNIVTIHSYGETDDIQYICMEYVSGKTLAQLLKEKKTLTESEAIPIFEQILLALEAANKEDIIHRDIKPANIMITDDDRVKVMDFGIAKLPTLSMTVTGMVLGTPFYMSPEQISGKKVDIRSDIFSVGAVFYQMLTGERPFDGDSTATITYKITLVEPVPPNVLNSNVSLPMARIILRALNKDTAQRYRTPTEMLEDVRNLHRAPTPEESAGTRIDAGSRIFQKTVLDAKPEEEKTPIKPVFPPPIPDSSPPEKPSASAGRAEAPLPAVREAAADKESHERGVHAGREGSPPAGKRGETEKGEKRSKSPLAIGLLVVFVVAASALLVRMLPSRTPTQAPGTSVGALSPAPTTTVPPAPTPPSPATTPPPPTLAPPVTVPPAATVSPPATSAPLWTLPPPASVPPPVQVPATSSTPPEASVFPGQTPSGEDQTRDSINSLVLEAGRQFVANPFEAQRLLEQALSLEPNNYDCVVMLARLLTFRKNYSAAIGYYRKALNLNGKAYELHYELGCLYLSQGNYDAAIPELESSLALGPPNRDDVLANLGFCYKQKNNPVKAQELFQQALEMNPDNQAAKSFLQSTLQSPTSAPHKTLRPPPPAPPAPSPTASKVEGTYRVEGTNPNGTKYRGTAIIKGGGARYTMTWTIAGQSYSGNGDLSGKNLTINWKDSSGNGGVVFYTLMDSGVLKGVWANGKGSETLTPLK